MQITNFIQISQNIATSGQPKKEDFATIAEKGYRMVINLALSTSDNALATEGDLVTELGMTYVHIPVQWERPILDQFHVFASTLQSLSGQKIWIHCALNMRVSAFMYLHNKLYLDMPEESAREKLLMVWEPNETWARYISDVLSAFKN